MKARNITPHVLEALVDTPVVAIQGARQTGKSTLVEAIAAQRAASVLTMDNGDLRNAARRDPAGFIDSLADPLTVIDEVQRAPELILPIKAAVDRDRRPGRFLLTGSADLMRVPGAGDSLAGRAQTLMLFPMSQGELVGLHDDLIGSVTASSLRGWAGWTTTTTRPEVIERITTGGYPEAIARADQRRGVWFDDYVDRLLRRDVDALRAVPPQRLRLAVELIAANQSGELVTAHLARHLRVAESTAALDVQTLADLYLTTLIPSWSRSLTNRRIKRPKALLLDSGLCARLGELNIDDLLSPIGTNHLGGLLEGFVVAELTKQATWSAATFRLFHYREAGGAEVDLLVELPRRRVLGIEVKATSSPSASHFTGLRALQNRLGDDFHGGIVFHLGQRALSFGDGMLALPVAALWELGSKPTTVT